MYKVVRRLTTSETCSECGATTSKEGLYGMFIDPDRDVSVEYIPGEWVEAPAMGLYVFGTLEEAKCFEFGREVWFCDVEDVTRTHYVLPNVGTLDLKQVKAFDRATGGGLVEGEALDWKKPGYAPVGSYLAQRVKLVRKVS